MLHPRIIPNLLIHNKGLVKTVNFKNPKYVGDPLNAVKIFNEKSVDELIITDIDASVNKSEIIYEDAIQEEPYINDPKQIAFYFTRNFKATIWVILFLYFSVKGFELFWDSLKGLINNLL